MKHAMESDTFLYRLKSWKWILLVFFSLTGILFMYGMVALFPDEIENVYAASLFSIAGCAAMCAVYARISAVVERRGVYELEIRRFFPDMSAGWLFGGGAMALSVVVMWMAGVYRVESVSLHWQGIVHDLFLFAVVAVGEELAFRGILLRMVEERWGTVVALVFSSLLFGFMHYTNDGGTVWSSIAIAITAIEAGSFLYARTLWMPIGAHWAWNFIQGNIFGIAVSGNDMGESLLHPSITGPEVLTGGAFGAEASVITVVIATGIAAWLIWAAYRRGNFIPFRCPWKRKEEHEDMIIESNESL